MQHNFHSDLLRPFAAQAKGSPRTKIPAWRLTIKQPACNDVFWMLQRPITLDAACPTVRITYVVPKTKNRKIEKCKCIKHTCTSFWQRFGMFCRITSMFGSHAYRIRFHSRSQIHGLWSTCIMRLNHLAGQNTAWMLRATSPNFLELDGIPSSHLLPLIHWLESQKKR